MPSGSVHATTTLMLATGFGVAAYYNGLPALPLAGGALLGVLLTPDLDVEGGCISQRTVRRAGCLIGALWSLYWTPYAMLFNHRSIWSHLPILSTASRLAYIGIPLVLLAYTLHLLPLFSVPWWWQWAAAGLATSDALHFALDTVYRPHKRQKFALRRIMRNI